MMGGTICSFPPISFMCCVQKKCGRNKQGYLSISSTHCTEAQLLATLKMTPTLIKENN